MGRTYTPISRAVETDADTVNFVRLMHTEARSLEHEADNRREREDGGFAVSEAAAVVRRFIHRVVEAASDDVKAQLKKEGIWN